MNYTNFDVLDFITDEYFQNWILHPDEQSDNYWNQFLHSNPGKRLAIDEAAKVLLHIKFREDIPDSDQVAAALEKQLHQIALLSQEGIETGRRLYSLSGWKQIMKVAAVFTGILLMASAVYYYHWRTATISDSTAYGEIKAITLPDSSRIILNANSTITYLKHWRKDQPREIQLTGEAYFIVTHLNKTPLKVSNSERFIVNTGDVKVEVLGTEFDVKNRREKTNVVLKSGKVKITFKEQKYGEITLAPGEMMSYRDRGGELKKTPADPLVATAWMDKKLILENASVNTIIEYLEDNYGYKVIVKDTAIGNKRLEGTLLLDNIKDIIFVLKTSLDIKIEKSDSTLIFSK
jgi:transmembrane sensor